MRTTTSMIVGVVVFGLTLPTWLWGEAHGIDTTILWAVVTPVVGALFIGDRIGQAITASQTAATQTNGTMYDRMYAAATQAVASQLAARDAARTRQAQGDVSQTVTPKTDATVGGSTLVS